MKKSEFLSYCLFFNWEEYAPQHFTENEALLWSAEKTIGDRLYRRIPNSKKEVAEYVASFVAKWDPYGFADIMSVYFSKLNDTEIKDYILRVYN